MAQRFRHWLTQELAQRGLSYREFGRRAGVSNALVSRTLSGDMPPSADFCIKVATTLNVSPVDTLILAGILPEDVPGPAGLTDPQAQELLGLFNALEPQQRQEALRYLRYLTRRDQNHNP